MRYAKPSVYFSLSINLHTEYMATLVGPCFNFSITGFRQAKGRGAGSYGKKAEEGNTIQFKPVEELSSPWEQWLMANG